MATSFGALSSDFYVNQKLALKMDLPTARETVLDMFDRVRKGRPGMDRFRRFEGELALESAPKDGVYDWLALRRTSIRSGSVNPESLQSAYHLHRLILEIAPYFLSISPLDIDYLELLFGFDLEAKGNHDEIVFDALLADTPLGEMLDPDAHTPLEVEPFLTFALDGDRRLQANVEVKTRSNDRDRDRDREEDKFDDEPISVFLSVRQVGPIDDVEELLRVFETLSNHAEGLATEKVIPNLLNPIHKAISSHSC